MAVIEIGVGGGMERDGPDSIGSGVWEEFQVGERGCLAKLSATIFWMREISTTLISSSYALFYTVILFCSNYNSLLCLCVSVCVLLLRYAINYLHIVKTFLLTDTYLVKDLR